MSQRTEDEITKSSTGKSNNPQHDLETCCCVDCCAVQNALAGGWVINDP